MGREIVALRPIGVIHSPYQAHGDGPIQGVFQPTGQGTVEVFPAYAEGLKDLEGFSHIYLLYVFHQAQPGYDLVVRPYLDTEEHGVFATRYPRRPNPIGLSVVRLLHREGNMLHIAEIDVLDGTPLLDIKPYVLAFDGRDDVRIGWLTGRV
jgi:tRNA-Thr(GGU) m(6)t(6)A37 methyltransferase TsaA